MEHDCNTCEHVDKKISELPCSYCENGNLWESKPKRIGYPAGRSTRAQHGTSRRTVNL